MCEGPTFGTHLKLHRLPTCQFSIAEMKGPLLTAPWDPAMP